MKMCLAPCFKGCTDEEYREEVGKVQQYFDSGGESLLRATSAERDQASANLQFENASGLHTRLEKIKPVASQLPEIVHRIDQLAAVMVQPSATAEAVCFFRIQSGRISGPVAFPIQSAEHAKSQSMESRVQQALATLEGDSEKPGKSALETMEHLALLKRWYYRTSRVGEILFSEDKGALPLRRIVRGIARVYRGEKAEAEPAGMKPGAIGAEGKP
jgi:excinuclease UvrABC nuclease subunit